MDATTVVAAVAAAADAVSAPSAGVTVEVDMKDDAEVKQSSMRRSTSSYEVDDAAAMVAAEPVVGCAAPAAPMPV